MNQIELREKLSLQQMYRLVAIAHETADPEIKLAAKALLEWHLRPDLPVDTSK